MTRIRDLITKAAMTVFEFNTRIVRPADKSFRINVATGALPYGDHVQIGICAEPGFPGAPWLVANFSPARARIIAHHLVEVADALDPPRTIKCDVCGRPFAQNDDVAFLPERGNYHIGCYLKKKEADRLEGK